MSENAPLRKFIDLADGETLVSLKRGYLKERSAQALVSLLSCLKESFVRVPMNVTMSDRDIEALNAAAKAGTLDAFTAKDEVRLRPEIITSGDGRRFFPMFSRKRDLPEQYAANFRVFEEAVINCVAMAKAMDGLNGLVLDPFGDPFIIPFDVAEMILNAKGIHQ